MKPGIDPKVDYAFKKVFGSESSLDLLASLVNAVLQPPGGPIVDLEILNPFSEKDTPDDKVSVLDIKARDASGRLFNIEMQMLALQHFRQRALYYWAKVYAQELEEGSDYHELHPTVSICFLDSQLFPQRGEYHHRFVLADQATAEVLTDHLSMHFLELPKFTLAADQLKTPLEVWCYFLRHGESLDSAQLPAALNIPPIHRALEVLNVLTQNDAERERYEARLKGLRDLSSARKDAREEGRKEGRKEGREEGREEGRKEGILIERVRLCQRVLKQAQTPVEELEKMSLEDLARLAGDLEKQALPPEA
jgi:predicted transposase/invertase (TIGR01784 family)